MPSGVLIDTSFLITLADDGSVRVNHDASVEFWRHFKGSGMPIYLSVIVVSEFEVKMEIPDEIRRACIPVVYNWDDAALTAKLDRLRERQESEERQGVKDDMKLIAQAVGRDVAFLITEDRKFAKVCADFRERLFVKFKPILLSDGFDLQLFRKDAPDNLTGRLSL